MRVYTQVANERPEAAASYHSSVVEEPVSATTDWNQESCASSRLNDGRQRRTL